MHTLGCPHACRRQEVLRIPLQLVQMVASRVTARLIRSTLLPAEGPGREARPDMDDLPTSSYDDNRCVEINGGVNVGVFCDNNRCVGKG